MGILAYNIMPHVETLIKFSWTSWSHKANSRSVSLEMQPNLNIQQEYILLNCHPKLPS